MQGLKVAFIGLGVMGYPMAGHLAKAGEEQDEASDEVEEAEEDTNEGDAEDVFDFEFGNEI